MHQYDASEAVRNKMYYLRIQPFKEIPEKPCIIPGCIPQAPIGKLPATVSEPGQVAGHGLHAQAMHPDSMNADYNLTHRPASFRDPAQYRRLIGM